MLEEADVHYPSIAEVLDFMPIDAPGIVSDRRRIVRVVRGVRGEVEFEARVEPRFDYGRRSHQVHQLDNPKGPVTQPSAGTTRRG